MVLLKNENETLPLKQGIDLMVIGYQAMESKDHSTIWSGEVHESFHYRPIHAIADEMGVTKFDNRTRAFE